MDILREYDIVNSILNCSLKNYANYLSEEDSFIDSFEDGYDITMLILELEEVLPIEISDDEIFTEITIKDFKDLVMSKLEIISFKEYNELLTETIRLTSTNYGTNFPKFNNKEFSSENEDTAIATMFILNNTLFRFMFDNSKDVDQNSIHFYTYIGNSDFSQYEYEKYWTNDQTNAKVEMQKLFGILLFLTKEVSKKRSFDFIKIYGGEETRQSKFYKFIVSNQNFLDELEKEGFVYEKSFSHTFSDNRGKVLIHQFKKI